MPVSIDCDMEDLVEVAMRQNFVPVVDDADNFIGIIRRSDILKYCYTKSKGESRTVTVSPKEREKLLV